MSTITTLRGGRIQGRDRQRGQALIYGIFVLIGALASLFFLFNTGQLSQEKPSSSARPMPCPTAPA